MANIVIRSNRFEDAVIITSENGQVIEAVVIHIGDSDPTFALGTYDSKSSNFDETYQTLYTCPVQAA